MTAIGPERAEYQLGSVQLVGDLWPGDEHQDIVVLAHGGGQTRSSWGRTAERLAASGRTVLNYDARGHGESGWDPSGDYTLQAFANDLLGLVGRLERPPILVGASLGGVSSLMVSGEYPEAIKALVLVDVVVDLEPAGVGRVRDFMRANAELGFASLEEVAAAVTSYTPERDRPTNLDGLRKNVRLHEDGRWYWHWDPAYMRGKDESRGTERTVRLREAASRVRVPSLLVRGGKSDVVSEQGIASMLRLMPNAESVDVAAAGHMVAGDDNDVFATALMAFLSRIDSPRA